MGMRGAQHIGVGFPGHSDIFDISAASGQKPEILEPAHRTRGIVSIHRALADCSGSRITNRPGLAKTDQWPDLAKMPIIRGACREGWATDTEGWPDRGKVTGHCYVRGRPIV